MRFWNLLRLFQGGRFSLIANIASIIGVLYIVFTNKTNAIIGLILLLIFLLVILIKLIILIDSFVSTKTLEGHLKLANYIHYSTVDGKQILWETHRYIQCKQLIMDEFEYLFFWTGSKPPQIWSTQQTFSRTIKSTKEGEFDKAIFKFKEPLVYNQFSIVEVLMAIDDNDGRSAPFCGQNVNEPIQLISFNVELMHLSSHLNARIERKRLNSPAESSYELIKSVPFDEKSRSYKYNVFNPVVGYRYRIYWGSELKPVP